MHLEKGRKDCYKLNCVLPKFLHYPSVPQNATIFGNQVLVDALDYGHTGVVWAPNQT